MWLIVLTGAFLLAFLPASYGFEPVTTVVAVSTAATLGLGLIARPIYCTFTECCSDRWIINNHSELQTRIGKQLVNLYGQHLADRSVKRLVAAHRKNSPHAALVLSFHGWTGTGKNHLARILARSLYTKGLGSKYVHMFSGTKDFPRAELINDYKDLIKRTIEEKSADCVQQLYIFDEVEKMPDGLLDVLSPYIDFHESLGGVDYRKSIFLLLSNAGGAALRDSMIKHWKAGKVREELELNTIEQYLLIDAFNERGGLKNSALITKGFISYVPFLPLQRSHVIKCIEDNMRTKNITITNQLVSMVMKELEFGIEGEFANSGCKRVHHKVDYVNEKQNG